MRTVYRIALVSLAAGALAGPVAAQDNLTLSERVERLERQAGSGGGGSVADLLMQVRRLEQEVRELRGMVEQQQHEIESLKARQRDQYLDLDQRLQSLRSGGSGNSSTGNDDGQGRTLASDRPETSAPADNGGSESPPVSRDDAPAQDAADAQPPVADAEARQEAYDAAFALLRDSEYAEAAEAFRAFLDEFPDGPLADNAQYWLGESYYVTGNFDIALNAFQGVLNRFPESPKAPDALLKLGFCYYELEQWDQARSTLEEVRGQYPDSSVARLAQNRLRLMRIDGR